MKTLTRNAKRLAKAMVSGSSKQGAALGTPHPTASCIAFCIALAAAAALPAPGAELLKNGDFEGGAAGGVPCGWKAVGATNYSCVAGAGRNGSSALVFDLKPGYAYGFTSVDLPLKPGMRYKVEGWIRTENLDGEKGWGRGGARIGVGVSEIVAKTDGTDRKRTSIQYSPGVRGTSDGWTKVEMIVETPARSTGGGNFVAFVERGNTGKAYFDDLSVTEIDHPVFGEMVSSAYRNAAKDGNVDFVVPVFDDKAIETRGVKAHFRISDGKGGWIAHPATIADGVARLATDVSSLPYGRRPVQFRATDKDGEPVAEREIFFDHVRDFPEEGVRFDSQGRATVDGKPFFPVGVFTHNMAEMDAECIGKSPFNVVMSYMDVDERILDLCHRHGFKVIANLSGAFAGGVPLQLPAIRAESDEAFLIADKVERMKRHPALMAWYAGDELELNELGRLSRHRALLEALDPLHPVWTVQCQPQYYSKYIGTFDVGGLDPYPIEKPGSEKDIGMVREQTRIAKSATFGAKPIWMALQLHNAGLYGGNPKETRPPTERELRNMCWQAIAEGANGIILFGYMSVRLEGREAFARRWPEACRVGGEIRDLSDLLLSDDATGEVSVTDSTDGISVRAWRRDGTLHVLVVNGSVEAGHCAVRADEAAKTVELGPLEHVFFSPTKQKGTNK